METFCPEMTSIGIASICGPGCPGEGTSIRIASMGGTLSPASSVWDGLGSWTLSPGMTSIGIASIKRTVSQ